MTKLKQQNIRKNKNLFLPTFVKDKQDVAFYTTKFKTHTAHYGSKKQHQLLYDTQQIIMPPARADNTWQGVYKEYFPTDYMPITTRDISGRVNNVIFDEYCSHPRLMVENNNCHFNIPILWEGVGSANRTISIDLKWLSGTPNITQNQVTGNDMRALVLHIVQDDNTGAPLISKDLTDVNDPDFENPFTFDFDLDDVDVQEFLANKQPGLRALHLFVSCDDIDSPEVELTVERIQTWVPTTFKPTICSPIQMNYYNSPALPPLATPLQFFPEIREIPAIDPDPLANPPIEGRPAIPGIPPSGTYNIGYRTNMAESDFLYSIVFRGGFRITAPINRHENYSGYGLNNEYISCVTPTNLTNLTNYLTIRYQSVTTTNPYDEILAGDIKGFLIYEY